MPAVSLKDKIHDLQEQIDDDDNVVAWPIAFNKRTFYGSEFPQEVGYKPYGIWFGVGPDWLDRLVFGKGPEVGYPQPHRAMQRRAPKHFVYKLELDKSEYLIINSDSQLKAFSKRYSLGPYDVNWPLVAAEFDGIEISPFLYRVAGEHDWYYPWDVASGCTWNADTVLGVEELS
jgi:hypothetical protein